MAIFLFLKCFIRNHLKNEDRYPGKFRSNLYESREESKDDDSIPDSFDKSKDDDSIPDSLVHQIIKIIIQQEIILIHYQKIVI